MWRCAQGIRGWRARGVHPSALYLGRLRTRPRRCSRCCCTAPITQPSPVTLPARPALPARPPQNYGRAPPARTCNRFLTGPSACFTYAWTAAAAANATAAAGGGGGALRRLLAALGLAKADGASAVLPDAAQLPQGPLTAGATVATPTGVDPLGAPASTDPTITPATIAQPTTSPADTAPIVTPPSTAEPTLTTPAAAAAASTAAALNATTAAAANASAERWPRPRPVPNNDVRLASASNSWARWVFEPVSSRADGRFYIRQAVSGGACGARALWA